MTIYRSYFNLTDYNLPISLQETLYVDYNCRNTPWKYALHSKYDRHLRKNIHININNPSVIPILTTKYDWRLKIQLCYPGNGIYPISLLLVEENCNNEDYCINYTGLVITCNYSLLTYFFDHDD